MKRRPGITAEMRREVARRVGAVENAETLIGCHYCSAAITLRWRKGRVQLLDVDGRFTPELDHVVPLFAGGPHRADNLVPACLGCNRQKWIKRAPEQAVEQLLEQTLQQMPHRAGQADAKHRGITPNQATPYRTTPHLSEPTRDGDKRTPGNGNFSFCRTSRGCARGGTQ